jgi:hypothetical protein
LSIEQILQNDIQESKRWIDKADGVCPKCKALLMEAIQGGYEINEKN